MKKKNVGVDKNYEDYANDEMLEMMEIMEIMEIMEMIEKVGSEVKGGKKMNRQPRQAKCGGRSMAWPRSSANSMPPGSGKSQR
ncbi:MAG: hypothetical protein N2039_08000 [Gemmataceae bacterium]|nr:hypothetical protein [Gemmataceae bacterium]